MAETTSNAATLLNRVPEVTLAFWVIKIMATTVGETGADFLAGHLDPLLAYGLIGAAFVAAMAAQFTAGRYVPWRYWLAVVLVSVVGTLVTDGFTDGLGVSLFISTGVFAVLLGITFIRWYSVERTLSIHTVFTPRRERFYWAAILFTFALGTAAGDLTAEQLQLGYALSVVVFGTMIAVVTIAYVRLRLNAVLAFWIAYVLTRPLGASVGDLLSQSTHDGGLGLGTTATSTVFLAAILMLVGYLTVAARRTTPAVSLANR